MREAQKTASAVDSNLINDSTLLRISIEAMCNCGLFEKAIDEWKEWNKTEQTWDNFQAHFLNAEEKFLIKRNIHDKKGGIGNANAAEETYEKYDECDYDP